MNEVIQQSLKTFMKEKEKRQLFEEEVEIIHM
jgi:hypothetical protein